MASWTTHLRVAEEVAKQLPRFSDELFWLGNMAPDCGVLRASGVDYDPPSKITHWCETELKRTIHPEWFYDAHLTGQHETDIERFYWGYYCHLLTDLKWVHELYIPVRAEYDKLNENTPGGVDKAMWYQSAQNDWRTIDAKFLQERTSFKPLEELTHMEPVKTQYFDYLPPALLEMKRQELIEQCKALKEKVLCESYRYTTPEIVKQFIKETADKFAEAYRRHHDQ